VQVRRRREYKAASDIRNANPGDLYQFLAHATSANVPSGMLIPAAGGSDVSEMVTRHSGTTLRSLALDLAATPEAILEQVNMLAHRIEAESSATLAA
jgi:hypothetical protein